MVVEDEGWHGAQVGKAGQAQKDVEMALLFPFAPQHATSSLPSEGGEYYFTNPTQTQRQRRPEQLDWKNMLSPSQHSRCTAESLHDNYSREETTTFKSPDWHAHSPISGYESLCDSDFASDDPYFHTASPVKAAIAHRSAAEIGEYEGLEGIYKFLQICEEAKR